MRSTSEEQPKFVDIRIVRARADLDPRMPAFVVAFLEGDVGSMMTTARFDKRPAGRLAASRAKDDVAFRKPDLRFSPRWAVPSSHSARATLALRFATIRTGERASSW
jgi:hypothetical protein